MIHKTTYRAHCRMYTKIENYLISKYGENYKKIQSSYPNSVNPRLFGPYMYDNFNEETSNISYNFIYKIIKF